MTIARNSVPKDHGNSSTIFGIQITFSETNHIFENMFFLHNMIKIIDALHTLFNIKNIRFALPGPVLGT